MTDFALLDVAIGVIFAILTFSLIASALQEALASALNWRGRMLRRGLFRLLEGATTHGAELVSATWLTPDRVRSANLTLKFLREPSIRSLYGPQNPFGRAWGWIVAKAVRRAPLDAFGRMPSSIPKETFARALIDTLLADAEVAYSKIDIADGITPKEVEGAVLQARQLLSQWAREADQVIGQAKDAVAKLPMDDQMKERLLRTLREVSLSRALQDKLDTLDGAADKVRATITARIDRAQATIDGTMLAVGAWFDSTMDRVTGWYVRRAKWVLFLLGLVMASVVNFDVIGYGDQLLNDEGLRRRIATQAEAAAVAGAVGGLQVERAGAKQLAAIRLDADRDGTVDEAEFDTGQAGLSPEQRLQLGLDQDPAAPVSPEARTAARAILNATLTAMPGAVAVDRDGDGRISPDEEDAAVELYLANLRNEIATSAQLLQDQLADQGVEMGWKCPGSELSLGCVGEQINLQTVISWFVIGLGCTLGGQFWFDLLRQVVKVKTAASGLNSDLKRLAGAKGGRAQGSGTGQVA